MDYSSGSIDSGTFKPKQSCTIFYASDGKVALAGNNEDYINPFTKIWFIPPKDGEYGRVFFGFNNFLSQGGMNDQGLFFDVAAVQNNVSVPPQEGKPRMKGSPGTHVMATCATVDDVLELFDRYSTSGTWGGHYLFGDRLGKSVIVEPLTRIRKQGRYQLITNFYHSTMKSGDYPCERYKIAKEMLDEADDFSVDLFRRILAAVHFETGSKTLYSNIYDLKRNLIYVYLFHNYENVVIINLDEELKKGFHVYDLPSLFPKTFAWERYLSSEKRRFEKLLFEKGHDTSINPKNYEKYVGIYQVPPEYADANHMTGDCFFITTSLEEGKIYAGMDLYFNEKRFFELYPQSESRCFHIYYKGDNFFKIEFIKDDKGVNRAKFEENGQTYIFKRLNLASYCS